MMARKLLMRKVGAGPLPNGGNGRDRLGRFAKGNPGGPGNPHAAAVGAWRSALAKSVTPDDLQDVIGQLLKQAKDGEPWAIRELLNRCLGRPEQALTIENEIPTFEQIVKVLRAKVDDGAWNGRQLPTHDRRPLGA